MFHCQGETQLHTVLLLCTCLVGPAETIHFRIYRTVQGRPEMENLLTYQNKKYMHKNYQN